MVIKTARLILRPFYEEDLADYFEYCSQSGIGEMAGWRHHENTEVSRQSLEGKIESLWTFAVVLKENGKVIGHIAANEDSEEGRADTKELGFALNKKYHQKGYMSEAVLKLLPALFEHGIKNVWACCFQENKASKGLIEKCGFNFIQEGTFYSDSLERNYETFEYLLTKEQYKERGDAQN